MNAFRINEAETILVRFFDPDLSSLAEWSFVCDAGTGGRMSQFWCGARFDWDRGQGRRVAMISRDLDLDLDGNDHLMLRMTLSETARLQVMAVIDDRPRTVMTNIPGKGVVAEYAGRIAGKRLTRIVIAIRDADSSPGTSLLLWLGLYNEPALTAMRSRPSPADGNWKGLLLPPGQEPAGRPQLGIFFAADALDALREKAGRPPYHVLVQNLRELALGFLQDRPWLHIGEFCHGHPGHLFSRDGDTGGINPLAMRLCAFIGLIDNDPRLLRMSLQHALAAAHCQHWQLSFMSTIPGGSWDARAFTAFIVGCGVAEALDWAGAYLTDVGREVLAQALSVKAVGWLNHSLMRYPYLRGCNQGVFVSYGSLVCQAALAKIWPAHGDEHIEVAKTAMDETIDHYIADDGGAFEGPTYMSATVGKALVGYAAYARLKKVPLASVVPARLFKVASYFSLMASTAPPIGKPLSIGDSSEPDKCILPSGPGMLAAVSGDSNLLAMVSGMLASAHERENRQTPGSVFTIIHGPRQLPTPGVRPPTFKCLARTGMLCSCRPTAHGPVRLQLIGAPAGAGHAHADKGSFILEAFGESLAIDRGMIKYADARCPGLKLARYHNLLIPDLPDGSPAHQINPCPTAVLPEGRGDADRLSCRIDASGVYPGLATRWSRSIESDSPLLFSVTDVMELNIEGTVAFHLHSHFPWHATPHGWGTSGERARLIVSPGQWQPTDISGKEDFIDGAARPVFHLVLRAAPAKRHELVTELMIEPHV